MSTPYSAIEHDVQGNIEADVDTVNIPSPADLAFFDHLLYTDDPELIRSIVLEECRLGVYDTETMMRLLMEFGAVALPERVSAPIPSVSRSDPFRPVSQGRGV
jgi:hypothetical protein